MRGINEFPPAEEKKTIVFNNKHLIYSVTIVHIVIKRFLSKHYCCPGRSNRKYLSRYRLNLWHYCAYIFCQKRLLLCYGWSCYTKEFVQTIQKTPGVWWGQLPGPSIGQTLQRWTFIICYSAMQRRSLKRPRSEAAWAVVTDYTLTRIDLNADIFSEIIGWMTAAQVQCWKALCLGRSQ